MQKAKNTPRSLGARARSNAREILLAMALTLGAAGFMVAAVQTSATPPEAASKASHATR